MFDGGEQFHQFIASSRTSLPIPTLSFPLHGNPSFSSAAFDSYAPPLHHQQQQPPSAATKNVLTLISTNLALESDRSTDPWSNDELLALLKVRSSMEIWFPDFTWEHVSRKLGELGFKRSGEECKEKFEEESRHYNNSVNIHNKNYRILSELDEFYHAHEHKHEHEHEQARISGRQDMDKADEVDQEKVAEDSRNAAADQTEEFTPAKKKSSKKRKRRDKFEMFKGFCEAVVNTMMAKQEELHQKLIHDIVKRDEEKIAREEAWKSQEMDRLKTEIETRSKEQKSAAERQATIIDFLKQFTCDHHHQQIMIQDPHLKNKVEVSNNNNNTNSNSNSNSSASFCQIPKTPSPSSPSNSTHAAKDDSIIPKPSTDHYHETTTHPVTPPPPAPCVYEKGGGGDVGKRWPRDEVLALINLRCKMSSNNGCDGQENSGSNSKGPLWERISQGMAEMGYKRNAKRCKEKWENINKYFRKTKDSSKKRSVNSRTCPYFHQLSCLYSDGTILAPNLHMPENH